MLTMHTSTRLLYELGNHRELRKVKGDRRMSETDKIMERQIEERRAKLQEKLGIFPKVYIERFRNWGRNQKALVLSVKPKSLAEIKAIIRAAKEMNLKIRCVGSAHSWSPLFSDDGNICMYMANLEPEDGQEKIKLNQESMTVTMLANTTSGEFLKFQLANDVCLMSNVTLESVHVAGLTAVGCHGAAKDEPCVSDYVTELKIVNSDGELAVYNSSDPEVLKAAQCNMGLFGVVYELTLKVEPMKIVETSSTFPMAKDCMLNPENLMNLARKNWCTEIFWFPFNSMSYLNTLLTRMFKSILNLPGFWDPAMDRCWVRTMNKVNIPSMPFPREEDYLMRRGLYFAENAYIRLFTKHLVETPSNVPGFLKAGVLNILMRFTETNVSEKLPMGIHYDSWVDLCPTTGVEYVFDVNDTLEDYQLASNACKIVMDVAKKFGRNGHFPVNITLQVRWTGKSESLMSPATKQSDQDDTTHAFYLCVVSVSGTPSWEDFVNELAKRLVKLPKKPHLHWAKQWGNILSMDNKYLRRIYKGNIEKFRATLEKTQADPQGMFCNERLKDLIHSSEDMVSDVTAVDETDGLEDELEDDVDGPDTPNQNTIKASTLFCKSKVSEWQHLCEHFATNYMTLQKEPHSNLKIDMDDKYMEATLKDLTKPLNSNSKGFLSWFSRKWNH